METEPTFGSRPDDPDDRDYILVDTLERLEQELAKLRRQGIKIGIWKPQRDKDKNPTNYQIDIYPIAPKKPSQIISEDIIVPLKSSMRLLDETTKINLHLPIEYSLYKGYFNFALALNGVDSAVVISRSSKQLLTKLNFDKNQDFTIELWIKADSIQADTQSQYNSILEKWDGDVKTGYPYAIRYDNNSGKLICSRYDGSSEPQIISKTAIDDGEFHHVAFVKKSVNLYLYIDGEIEGRTTDETHENNSETRKTSNESNFYIGGRGGHSSSKITNYFKGKVNNISIWNTALLEDDIQCISKKQEPKYVQTNNRLFNLYFDLSEEDLKNIFQTIKNEIIRELALSQSMSEILDDIIASIAKEILAQGVIYLNTIYKDFFNKIKNRLAIDKNLQNQIEKKLQEITNKTLNKVFGKFLHYGNLQLRNFDNWSKVKTQGSISACTTHAAISLLEYFERKASERYQDYSRLFLYYVAVKLSNKEDYEIIKEGLSIREVMAALISFGVPPEKHFDYPKEQELHLQHDLTKFEKNEKILQIVTNQKIPSAFAYALAQKYSAKSYFRLKRPGQKNMLDVLDQIKIFIYAGFPPMFGFRFYQSALEHSQNHEGEIAFPNQLEPNDNSLYCNHAAVAVGYNDNREISISCTSPDESLKKCIQTIQEKYGERFIKIDDGKIINKGAFKIRNSYGEEWGDKGYGWLPYAYVLAELESGTEEERAKLTFDWWSMLKAEWFDTDYFGISNRDEGIGSSPISGGGQSIIYTPPRSSSNTAN